MYPQLSPLPPFGKKEKETEEKRDPTDKGSAEVRESTKRIGGYSNHPMARLGINQVLGGGLSLVKIRK